MVDGSRGAGAGRLNESAEYAFNGLQVTTVKAISRLRLAVGDSSSPSPICAKRVFVARYLFGVGSGAEGMSRGMR